MLIISIFINNKDKVLIIMDNHPNDTIVSLDIINMVYYVYKTRELANILKSLPAFYMSTNTIYYINVNTKRLNIAWAIFDTYEIHARIFNICLCFISAGKVG